MPRIITRPPATRVADGKGSCEAAAEDRAMSRVQVSDALREHMMHPPPGSALERAKAFGIDPTLTFYNMYALSLDERIERGGAAIRSMADLAKLRVHRARRP